MKQENLKQIVRKINLYIISLALLFIFIALMTVDIPYPFSQSVPVTDYSDLLRTNFVALSSLGLLGYCYIAYRYFEFELKGAPEIPLEIRKIESIDYEHLTFLATYVVPLISFDFSSTRQMLVLALLLVVMGIIYVKTDLFYANPSLSLLGYRIFKADGNFQSDENREGIILICKGNLNVDEKVDYIKLDNRIYYVQKKDKQ